MRGAMVILVAMIVIGTVLYLTDVFYYRKKDREKGKTDGTDLAEDDRKTTGTEKADDKEEETDSGKTDGECCGLHLVCEKNSLSPMSDEIIYYDDDELDRFKGRKADEYDSEEIEEFRDVMMTLLPEDVAGWARSLQLRRIEPPSEIRDELFMLVREIREKK